MSSTDPNLGLNYGWTLGESGWDTGMDANLKRLGAVVGLSVKDRDLTTPPASPANYSAKEILAEVARHGVRHVCVTGGEPLAQKRCIDLLQRLCDAGYDVSLETSGALDIAGVDPRVSRVVDLKTPGSAEQARNRLENLPLLTARDQVKFVLCGRGDYEWARAMVAEHRLAERCEVLFSPSKTELEPRELADWIVADRLPVRFQMQLHKLLWNDEPGR